jgi:uncharacterized protein YegJ (DUF2314 family)
VVFPSGHGRSSSLSLALIAAAALAHTHDPALASQGFQTLTPTRASTVVPSQAQPAVSGFKVLGGAPPPAPARTRFPERRETVAPAGKPASPQPRMAEPSIASPPMPPQPEAVKRDPVRPVSGSVAVAPVQRISPVMVQNPPRQPAPAAPVATPIREAALNPTVFSGSGGLPKPDVKNPQISVPLPSALDPAWAERTINEASRTAALPVLDTASFGADTFLDPPGLSEARQVIEGLNMEALRDLDNNLNEGRRLARQSLQAFLARMQKPPSGSRHYAVKIILRHEGYEERIWVGDIEGPVWRKLGPRDKLAGNLLNLPEIIDRFNFGDRVTFTGADIEDWTYVTEGGRFVGNFTGCAAVATEGEEALLKLVREHGLDCSWLKTVQAPLKQTEVIEN